MDCAGGVYSLQCSQRAFSPARRRPPPSPGGRDVLGGRHMVSSLETHTGHGAVDRPVADDAGMVSAPAPSPCWVSRPPRHLDEGCNAMYTLILTLVFLVAS